MLKCQVIYDPTLIIPCINIERMFPNNSKKFSRLFKGKGIPLPSFYTKELLELNQTYKNLTNIIGTINNGEYGETINFVENISESSIQQFLFEPVGRRFKLKDVFILYTKLHPIFLGKKECRWYETGLKRA